MRLVSLFALAVATAAPLAALPAKQAAPAPQAADSAFTFEEAMIPMRDGVKLHTVIIRPKGQTGPLPILFQRTPYGTPGAAPRSMPGSWAALGKDGYVFVFQDMRGRFGSEGGPFTLSTEIKTGKGATDESTDAYDSIDWLVKNVKPNNGKVGMWGVSYPGFTAAIAVARPHPALKAVSPQAAWIDYWKNDDLHRWGAMRLTYASDWVNSLQADKTNDGIEIYDRYDTYEWFLKAGSPADIEAKYFKGRVPLYKQMIEHPDYDDFWKKQVWSDTLKKTTVPTLNVAGYWDQEDPWGSWQIFDKQRENDPNNLSLMVAGPWNHGSWRSPGNMLGRIPIGTDSGTQFMEQVEAPFFAYWLHGKGTKPDYRMKSFQSGSWQWKTYNQWPLTTASSKSLYLHADGSVSFTAPAQGEGCREYISDPANPVPFRARPMSATYATPDWRWWETEDQRFVEYRPDVLSYTSAPLDADLTITGAITAALQAATSGTDSDFIVKLIDVYPEDFEKPPTAIGAYAKGLNGYQLPIAMEVKRGRYLQSMEKSTPLVPNQVNDWTIPLRNHDHVFKKGHRIMVQIQSSWFPMIDRNPQTFVPNIYKAKPADYQKATQKVCSGSAIMLPVVGN
ncbi:putative CocE/NonD family hydrolase [Sphingomonas kyeonggiensis]|uniref:CocE/NonD family hydrolase n=1 Tax=Sphingomonas kyeonggiensis TaxID=1268553 RepID=UPI002781C8DC|nr:CocE/NonD family hydrolase [Sphingomonas kyeonggiensis]MDQ0248988.1 putative CocE/NonD family hydrolase [Sphingomonas kyeonggiensis]